MAKKMTPAELRAKAKEMLEKAKLDEDKRYLKIGRLVEKELNENSDFSSDDARVIKPAINSLKTKINLILKD